MSMISSGVLVDGERGGPVLGGQGELSPSIQLLLRFQRLLVSHLFPVETNVSPRHIMQGIKRNSHNCNEFKFSILESVNLYVSIFPSLGYTL